MLDNDPKHTSRAAQEFYAKSGINWWRTPAESPDMNPIENLWHELKEYICTLRGQAQKQARVGEWNYLFLGYY